MCFEFPPSVYHEENEVNVQFTKMPLILAEVYARLQTTAYDETIKI